VFLASQRSDQLARQRWRFNTNTRASEEGRLPLLATNVSNVAGFDRNSLQINNTNVAAILKYRTIETNGLVNFTPLRTSIRFCYKPFWNGPAPGDWVRLFEEGKWTSDSSIGLFALSIDPYGTKLERATNSMANATCLIWRRRQLLGVRGLATKAGAPSPIFIPNASARGPACRQAGHPHRVLSRSTKRRFHRGLFHREVSRQPS